MPLDGLTIQAFGAAEAEDPADTVVCTLSNPGAGRWRVWVVGKHAVVDGLKLLVGSTEIVRFSMSDYETVNFGPIVVDILNNTDDIILALAAALPVDTVASGNLFAQRIYP